MKPSDIKNIPDYFDYYIHLNEDIELSDAFDNSLKQIDNLDLDRLHDLGLKVYAEGKWTVHQIIQHISDWERIWSYRTLISMRNEGTMPPGLDHNIMADNSNANQVPLAILINELRIVRLATISMFETFSQDMFEADCVFNNNSMSTLAMGFNIIGHQIHHFNVIRDKYLPLI